MDINMTLLLALSVLLASPCHLAAPEFFVRDLRAGEFLYIFFCFYYLGASLGSRGGILSLCFKDRSQSSFIRMGRRGILKTWVLSLIPIWIISIFFILKTYNGPCLSSHLNYFHLFIRMLRMPCLNFLFEARGEWRSPSEAGGGNIESSCWLYPEV